jgi:hypothetical protein
MPRSCLGKWMPIDKVLTQGCANLGSYVAVAPTFWMVAPIICGSSVRNLPHVALLASRILRWKICVVNEVSTRNLRDGTKWGTWYVTRYDPMTIKPQNFVHPHNTYSLSGRHWHLDSAYRSLIKLISFCMNPFTSHPGHVQLSVQYAVFRGSLVYQPRLFLHDAAECPASV